MVRIPAVAMAVEHESRLFQTFVARMLCISPSLSSACFRVIALEGMANMSSQRLAVFQQELGNDSSWHSLVDLSVHADCWNSEVFRRSPLNSSSVVAQVLASEPSDRLKAYQEAGYRDCHTGHGGLVELDCALKFLQNHVQQEGAESSEIAQVADIGNRVNFAPRADIGQISSSKIKVRQLFTPDSVTTMAAIYGMLQQDFTMQERVVATLGLDLSPELLQNYQMMWALPPFMDESAVEEALRWTIPFTA